MPQLLTMFCLHETRPNRWLRWLSVESESGCDDVGFVEESTIKFALVPEYVLALMCRF